MEDLSSPVGSLDIRVVGAPMWLAIFLIHWLARFSLAVGWREISPTMPYYSPSASSACCSFGATNFAPQIVWNSKCPSNWSRSVLGRFYFAYGKVGYFRSQWPDLFSHLCTSFSQPAERAFVMDREYSRSLLNTDKFTAAHSSSCTPIFVVS